MRKNITKLFSLIFAGFARKIIAKHKPFVVGVTGSVGKTSTKEAIYQIMADHFGKENVRKNQGNLNTEIGLPLAILGYGEIPNKFILCIWLFSAFFRTLSKQYPKYLILEYGINQPDDMEFLISIVKPKVVVITSLSGAHMANFKSLSDYQEEKTKIITDQMKKIFLNGDDKDTLELKFDKDKTSFVGIKNKDVDFYAADQDTSLSGTTYNLFSLGQKISIKSSLIGEHLIYPQLFGYGVGRYLGIQALEIKRSLERIKPFKGRMNIINGKKDTTIIDDTYNSNPISCKSALLTLAKIKYNNRKVAILGEMNELGNISERAHLEIAKFAKEKADLAIFVGKYAKSQAEAFGDGSLFFASRGQLEKSIMGIINEGDLILVKASQDYNYFEELTKILMKNAEDAKEILVRQTGTALKACDKKE